MTDNSAWLLGEVTGIRYMGAPAAPLHLDTFARARPMYNAARPKPIVEERGKSLRSAGAIEDRRRLLAIELAEDHKSFANQNRL